jgi:Asp-tRNA(Asn)/Glu-tRNA(Gln) amidotransferase A subunit family amidase
MASFSRPSSDINLVEATIDDLAQALSTGSINCVDLIAKYLHRIALYDWHGVALNSIPLLNPTVFQEAAASDARRAGGLHIRPLEGIPYTIKDNFSVAGMTAAAGSPAFQDLKPKYDSFVVERLRAAGAILIGKTNMPPMAAGGMQRGLYGRAESPYNSKYLTAAFASGSSNGSATSTAASFAAFSLGSETVSSGRSPASNNGLVAYTPSRGAISCRGLWPLYATCDVVTPYTRSMDDMLKILEIITEADPSTQGDFWRKQSFIKLPQMQIPLFEAKTRLSSLSGLSGKRIGVPAMFIGNGNATDKATHIAKSVVDLWIRARADLESLGATVVETDFPALTEYENDHASDQSNVVVGCPPQWAAIERTDLIAFTWEDFLLSAEDPRYPSLGKIDPETIFPKPDDYLPDRFIPNQNHLSYSGLVSIIQQAAGSDIYDNPYIKSALESLEEQRKKYLEDWMDDHELDMIVFPANGDVACADVEINEESARAAMRNGVKFSHGNRIIRHLGIPTVNVSMGLMCDTNMPVNLTFAGKAYQDNELLQYAYAYEQKSHRRVAPPLTPALKSDSITMLPISALRENVGTQRLELTVKTPTKSRPWCGDLLTTLEGSIQCQSSLYLSQETTIEVYIGGKLVSDQRMLPGTDGSWKLDVKHPPSVIIDRSLFVPGSDIRSQEIIVVLARSPGFSTAGQLVMLGSLN